MDLMRRGVIRIPHFQRILRWRSKNVEELFDSVYRGYPVGSLLFYRQAAPADRLELGPLTIDAPEIPEAWWVIDGQQRLAALAVCLLRPVPLPGKPTPSDPFVLYFDAGEKKFEAPVASGKVPTTWVPLPYLLDASRLAEWIFSWEHRSREELRLAVFDAGARIRDYLIPLYLIEADRNAAKEIFYRTNLAGEPLKWKEVHKALFGADETAPSTLEELADELTDVGMGRLDPDRVLTCLMALRGLDPTRNLAEHRRKDHDVLSGAVGEALPVLRRVLSFLRADAGIPHLRLLPKSILLDVLTRFFAQHPNPHPRTRMLLSRWFWRTALGAGAFDERTLRRRGISAVDEDEEGSVQRLLRLALKEPPRQIELPSAFDARSDESRLALLALVHLGPRSLLDGNPVDVPDLLERDGKDAFLPIVRSSGAEGVRSPANRIIHPRGVQPKRLLQQWIATTELDHPVLSSHAIDRIAADALKHGDDKGFLSRRTELLTREVRRFAERMAAWEQNDRPSIDALLKLADVAS